MWQIGEVFYRLQKIAQVPLGCRKHCGGRFLRHFCKVAIPRRVFFIFSAIHPHTPKISSKYCWNGSVWASRDAKKNGCGQADLSASNTGSEASPGPFSISFIYVFFFGLCRCVSLIAPFCITIRTISQVFCLQRGDCRLIPFAPLTVFRCWWSEMWSDSQRK